MPSMQIALASFGSQVDTVDIAKYPDLRSKRIGENTEAPSHQCNPEEHKSDQKGSEGVNVH